MGMHRIDADLQMARDLFFRPSLQELGIDAALRRRESLLPLFAVVLPVTTGRMLARRSIGFAQLCLS